MKKFSNILWKTKNLQDFSKTRFKNKYNPNCKFIKYLIKKQITLNILQELLQEHNETVT